MEDYIKIMIESLEKKTGYLRSIIEKNAAQEKCILGKTYDEVDWNAFNLIVTEKEILIERINTMDEGFQSLFDRIKDQIKADKDRYADDIAIMQELIKKIVDLGVEIRTGEERNRRQIENIMGSRKEIIKGKRNSLKAAQSYYQSMHSQLANDYTVMDRKK